MRTSSQPWSSRIAASRRASVVTALCVAIVGIAVVLGWCWNIPELKRLAPQLPNMAFNAAVAFAAAGGAPIALRSKRWSGRAWSRYIGYSLGTLVLLVGGLTLVEFLSGYDLHIDQLLVADDQHSYAYPGRPSPLTASCFALAGLSLLLLDRRPPVAQALALVQLFLASLAIGGYLFGVSALSGASGMLPLALHTAVALWLLALSLLMGNPSIGPMRLILSDLAGGVMFRRLLILPLVFVLVGRLIVEGSRIGLYDELFGFALMVVCGVMVSLVATSAVAQQLSRLDRAREGILRRLQRRFHATRASEVRQRALLDATSEVIYRMSPDWSRMIELKGRAFLADTAEPTQEWLNQYIYPEDQPLVMRTITAAVQARSIFELEHRVRRADGTVGWTFSRAVPLLDENGQILEWFGAASDVTERKNTEQRRVADQFISIVSHELRTPLTSIRGALGLILGTLAGELSEKMKTLLEIAQGNSERLMRLINDILDIDKIASGQMQFALRAADLSLLIRNTVHSFEAYAHKLDVRVEIESPEVGILALVDEDRFAQVLFNLLSNAVKFSPAGGTVKVSTRPSGQSVRVSVQDFGPGIPLEFRSRIFQRFSQADASSTRKVGGAGLGLHISRQIVEGMGGQLGFESEVGQGTTFWVQLPVPSARDVNPRSAAQSQPQLPPQ
jgi:signal transduction histidine kinase